MIAILQKLDEDIAPYQSESENLDAANNLENIRHLIAQSDELKRRIDMG